MALPLPSGSSGGACIAAPSARVVMHRVENVQIVCLIFRRLQRRNRQTLENASFVLPDSAENTKISSSGPLTFAGTSGQTTYSINKPPGFLLAAVGTVYAAYSGGVRLTSPSMVTNDSYGMELL